MITARIGHARLTHDDGVTVVSHGGNLYDAYFVERHLDYNPRRGGAYQGYDPSNEIEVLDALARMKRDGLDVEILEQPAASETPVTYFEDLRDEAVRLDRARKELRANPYPTEDADDVPMPYARDAPQPRKRPS